MLAALHDADVRFVLIGGMAAILHGDVGVTVDIDIAPANDSDNLECLAAALRALDAPHPHGTIPHRVSPSTAPPVSCAISDRTPSST